MQYFTFLNFFTHPIFPGLELLTLADLLFVLIAVSFIINNRKIKIFPFLTVLIFMVIFLIGTSVSANQNGKFNSVLYLVEVITLFYGLTIFILFQSYVYYTPQAQEKLVKFWFYGGICVVISFILVKAGLAPASWSLGNRVSGSFKTVNQTQSYLVPFIIIVAHYFSVERRLMFQGMFFGLLIVSSLCLLFTGSRSSLIFLIFPLALMIDHSMTRRGLRPLLFLGYGALSIITYVYGIIILEKFLFYSFDPAISRLLSKLIEVAVEGELGPRAVQAQMVKANFIHYPSGIGLGQFQKFFDYKNEVHNTFLSLLIELGWAVGLGFTFFYIVIITSILMYGSGKNDLIKLLLYIHCFFIAYQIFNYGFRQRIFWLEFSWAVYSCFSLLNYVKHTKDSKFETYS